MRKGLSVLLAFVMMFATFSMVDADQPSAGTSSWDFIEKMGKGINLGNTLESPLEGEWAMAAKEYYFDDFKTAGFNNVRIPVRWDKHMGTTYPYTIDTEWLDRVEEVVDWSLSRGFITILNSHHDDWIKENYSDNIERFEKLWEQVAERFKDKSENLVFEICNEPFGKITNAEVNDMNHRILKKIRVENPTRFVIIGGGSWNSYNTLLTNVELPVDPYIIGNFHYYEPQSFTQLSIGTWGSDGDKLALSTAFEKVKAWSVKNNVPVLLGEFGVLDYVDRESRIKYYDYITDQALINGFAFSVWDNGTFGSEQYDMAFYKRQTREYDQPILDAILNTPVITTSTPMLTATPEPTRIPSTPAVGEMRLLDYEDPMHIYYWVPYNVQAPVTITSGEGNPGSAMKVSYTGSTAGYWGVATLASGGDWSAWQKVSFDIKSENANPLRLVITEKGTIAGQDGEHWEYTISPTKTWTTVSIPFTDFIKRTDYQIPTEDGSGTLDLYKLNNVHFTFANAQSDTIFIDNIKLIGLSPNETPKPTSTATPTPTPETVIVEGYVKPNVVSVNKDIKAGFKVEAVGTSAIAYSDANGYFRMEGLTLAEDAYTIKISKPGYLTRTITGIPGDHNSIIGSSDSLTEMWAGDIPVKGVQDDAINMVDIVEIGRSFNSIKGSTEYSADKDFNMDDMINMIDIMIVAKKFNKVATDYPAIKPVLSNELAAVTVDTEKSLNTFAATGVGVNTGVFDEFMLGKDLPGRLMDAGIKVCRYPDGIPSDQYHWKTHTLDPNPQKMWLAPNATFDDYMKMVKKSDAEALITVNYGSGTPEEAAEWVSYANKTKKYNVKYWEIGNEIYGNGFYGSQWSVDLHEDKSPSGYGKNALAYIKAMKAVDPDIKVGVPLIIPGDWPGGITPDWNSTVLSLLGSEIDFVVIHFYPQQPMMEDDEYILSSTGNIEEKLQKLRTLLKTYCGEKADKIQTWVTESNSSLPPGSKQQLSIVGAMFIADNYASWLKYGASNVDWETLHCGPVANGNNSPSLFGDKNYCDWGILSNGMGADYVVDGWPTGKSNMVEPIAPPLDTPYPVWYGLKMLNYLASPGDKFISSTSDQEALTVHAVKQADGTVAILLINKSPDETYDVSLNIEGFKSSGSGMVYRYGKESSVIESEVQKGETCTVEPYSLNVVVIYTRDYGV